jgi:NADPH:quinone reductase-like Zn-dependent oxidoreductase
MIHALVVEPSAPNGVALTRVPTTAGPVVVDVHYVSLNLGDLNDARSGRVPPGAVLGSDVAGVVVQTIPDGPPIGTRVVALTSELLAPGGNIQSIGWSSGEPAVFPPYATVGPAKSLTSFMIDPEKAAPDLTELVTHLANGHLPVTVGWQGPLSAFDKAATALRTRQIKGKAILHP